MPYANLTNPQTLNLYAMVADDPESFADLDGHCDPGLDCLQANLKSAANKVAEGYEKAADAIVTVAKDTVNTAGAGVGELVAGVASGDSGKINEGMGKLVLVALPFIADAPEARIEESAGAGAAARGEAAATEPHPSVTAPYERPTGATTAEQRATVQGKPCVDCGKTGDKMVANHKTPLVKEYYTTGKIDTTKMRSKDSVNSQCPTCSAKQGAQMAQYSKQMKAKINEREQ